ncbi:MAG: hypothetical protein EAZ35_10870 [Sphingobacteriia bacterium]|jgi:GLPGLI family protein|nr:MAG: hypothetical protein EAZ35_10870 [Sphingobacteriia bacterium]
MRSILLLLLLLLFGDKSIAQTRVVAEVTLVYSIEVVNELQTDKEALAQLKQSSKTVYIKGNNSRVDLNSPSFSQSLIYSKGNGTAVILREMGTNKFMTKLDSKQWNKQNEKFTGMMVKYPGDTKIILGYDCKKAILQLQDGSTFSVYYTTAISPSVREFEYQFKDIPGFVLQYEAMDGYTQKIIYTATKINLNPVAASKFDIPTSGYRLLNN